MTVTKSSGAYFWRVFRVWLEAVAVGMAPFWVGTWQGKIPLSAEPNPGLVRYLMEGASLSRRQANRVGCFDITFTFPKSISLLVFGLTPPGKWKEWLQPIAGFSTAMIEKELASQIAKTGPQGKNRLASRSIAVAFVHYLSSMGKPHGNIHYAVPNLTATRDGSVYSIGKAVHFYQKQGEWRALFNKQIDELLQKQGIATIRVGRHVELANVPRGLLDELSPSRQAINHARTVNRFSSAKAHDFYARYARNGAPKTPMNTPQEVYAECQTLLKKHGVTLETLKSSVPRNHSIHDPLTCRYAAYSAARKAIKVCSMKYGRWTESQFKKELYTLAIEKPTTVQSLDFIAKEILAARQLSGVTRVITLPDGISYYSTRRGQRRTRRAEGRFLHEAWKEFGEAVAGLRDAVLVSVIDKGSEIARRLKETIHPAPKTRVIDGKVLEHFVKAHLPTNYVIAHAKALLHGLLSRGGPHEKALAAENRYRELRGHARLSRNTVLIVRNGGYASSNELYQLGRIAKRDKSFVFLCERERFLARRSRNKGRAHHDLDNGLHR